MSVVRNALGERLTAAREARALSVQKAADRMHLDPAVIEALESGEYERIGPAVYVKGHLKRYAELIGMPVEEALQAYGSAPPQAAPVAAAQPMPPIRAREPRDLGPSAALVALGATVLLVSALLYRWHPWARAVPATAATASAAVALAGTKDGNADEPASLDQAAEPGQGALARSPARGAGENETTAGAGRARLRLSFSADSWVDVHDASGRRLYAGSGRANSVRTIAGDAPMKVYLGFASGVQLQVNSRVVAIGPQFLSGDVARFEAGADGVLRRDTRSAAAANPHPRG